MLQLMSQKYQTTASLLKVCDLASSLGNTALAQVSYSVLSLCPPDNHTLTTLQNLFHEESPTSSNSVDVDSAFYNQSSPQVLYHLEVSCPFLFLFIIIKLKKKSGKWAQY